MKKIIIKESEWLRGKPMAGVLRDIGTGKKCCLGFVCEEFGVKPEEMENIGMPAELSDEINCEIPSLSVKGEAKGYFIDTEFSNEAQSFNDAEMDDEERKFWLKILAHDAGYDFQFAP